MIEHTLQASTLQHIVAILDAAKALCASIPGLGGMPIDIAAAELNLTAMQSQATSCASIDARIRDLEDELCDPDLENGLEALLRAIHRLGRKDGYCWASHETIATKAGLSKSTVGRLLVVAVRRQLIKRHECRGSSDVILLADGLGDALREKATHRRKPHARVAPRLGREFSMPDGARRRINGEKPLSMRSEAPHEEKKPVIAQSDARPWVKLGSKDPTGPNTSPSYIYNTESTTLVDAKNEKKQGEVLLRPSDPPAEVMPQPESKQAVAVSSLVAEGVIRPQARKLVREFGVDRVSRNLALGSHAKASNPGGFLMAAIREDYAASARPRKRGNVILGGVKMAVEPFDPFAGFNDPFAPDEPEQESGQPFGQIWNELQRSPCTVSDSIAPKTDNHLTKEQLEAQEEERRKKVRAGIRSLINTYEMATARETIKRGRLPESSSSASSERLHQAQSSCVPGVP